MNYWTNKGQDNEVSDRLSRTQHHDYNTVSAPRPTPRTDADARLLAGLDQAAHCIAVCAFTLAAIVIAGVFLSLAPSLTGQAQEGAPTGASWMGEKLATRSYQAPTREARP